MERGHRVADHHPHLAIGSVEQARDHPRRRGLAQAAELLQVALARRGAELLPAPPLGEARRSRHGRFAYVLMISCFMLTLLLPRGVGEPLALVGTLAVSLSFLHSFWERYNPIRST